MSDLDYHKLAMGYLDCINNADSVGFAALFADDAEIWVAGKVMSKSELGNMLTGVTDLFTEGPTATCENIFSHGNQVALEMSVIGNSKKGRVYKNRYCLIFTFGGNRIAKFFEYLDPAPAAAALF